MYVLYLCSSNVCNFGFEAKAVNLGVAKFSLLEIAKLKV